MPTQPEQQEEQPFTQELQPSEQKQSIPILNSEQQQASQLPKSVSKPVELS